MKSIIVAALALCAAGAHATDLRPVLGERKGDGVARQQLEFADGGSSMAFLDPPRGWSYSGSPTRLTLTPDWAGSAAATITRRPIAAAESIPASPEERAEWAKARAPREAENVEFVEGGPLGMQIDGIELFGATFRYTLVGREIRVTLWLLNRKEEQLQFQVMSNNAEHGPVVLAFRRSLYSMHWSPRQSAEE